MFFSSRKLAILTMLSCGALLTSCKKSDDDSNKGASIAKFLKIESISFGGQAIPLEDLPLWLIQTTNNSLCYIKGDSDRDEEGVPIDVGNTLWFPNNASVEEAIQKGFDTTFGSDFKITDFTKVGDKLVVDFTFSDPNDPSSTADGVFTFAPEKDGAIAKKVKTRTMSHPLEIEDGIPNQCNFDI